MTIGTCGGCLVFIGSETSNLIEINWVNETFVILIITMPMMILSLFRSYAVFTKFNVMCLTTLFAASVVVIYHSTREINFNFDDFVVNKNDVKYLSNGIYHYPLFLGNSVFFFIIHSVVIPIEQSMSDWNRPKMSSDYKSALKWSTMVLTIVVLSFSGYAYIAFGDNVCGNVLNNLDQNNIFTKIVIIILCVNLFFAYVMFLFPMTEALEHSMFDMDHKKDNKLETKRNLLRISMVIMSSCIAILVPDFSLLFGLTGAFGNTVLGLILPPIMYFRLKKMDGTFNEISIFEIVIGCLTTLFGVGIFFVSTYTFIKAIVKSDGDSC